MIQTKLTGHHLEITAAIKQHVVEKMRRLERHFDYTMHPHIILSVEKNRHRAEATLTLNGSQIFANAIQDDMYSAVDTLVDKLERQIARYKEKHTIEPHRAPKPSKTIL